MHGISWDPAQKMDAMSSGVRGRCAGGDRPGMAKEGSGERIGNGADLGPWSTWGATIEDHNLGDLETTDLEIRIPRYGCQQSPIVKACLLLQMTDLSLFPRVSGDNPPLL